MTLVERFIEINAWPTSRKTALLAGLGLVIHLTGWVTLHAGLSLAGTANVALLDQTNATGAIALVLCLAASLAAVRAGKDAPWTAYMLAVLYGAFAVGIVQRMGSWSTPLFAAYPVMVVLVALYYGERIGWFAFCYGLFLFITVGSLEAAGILPYAPALLDRSVDAQLSYGWVAGTIFLVMLVYIFCFVLGLLVVAAMKLQGVRLQAAQKLIRRYVPSQVADTIVSGRAESADQHERRKLTLFFSDLVGFTEIAEEMEPEDLSQVLNEYFAEMTAIAQKHGGTVDELSGDAILIFFGAPQATSDKDHALRAVRMAIEMQAAMEKLNAKWRGAGIGERLTVRIGINTGVVTIGNFGSPERMKYAALGKHVNLASRLQANCEPGKVLLSHATWLLVNDQMPCTPKGEMNLKGIHKPVMTYELSGQA